MSAARAKENKINTLFKFTVEGKGEFPWDMLRHDRCWPATSEQTTELAPYYRSVKYHETRQVKFDGLKPPTEARWESFGWKVIKSEVSRVG